LEVGSGCLWKMVIPGPPQAPQIPSPLLCHRSPTCGQKLQKIMSAALLLAPAACGKQG
jgi:hypothetical protein